MPIPRNNLVALHNPSLDYNALIREDEERLQKLLEALYGIQKTVTNRIINVRRAMDLVRRSQPGGLSYVEKFPDDALEGLELPEKAEFTLGRKGLGIRTIGQLTKFSRVFLGEQLRDYRLRTENMFFDDIDDQDIEEWLDAVESKLGMRNLHLAVPRTH